MNQFISKRKLEDDQDDSAKKPRRSSTAELLLAPPYVCSLRPSGNVFSTGCVDNSVSNVSLISKHDEILDKKQRFGFLSTAASTVETRQQAKFGFSVSPYYCTFFSQYPVFIGKWKQPTRILPEHVIKLESAISSRVRALENARLEVCVERLFVPEIAQGGCIKSGCKLGTDNVNMLVVCSFGQERFLGIRRLGAKGSWRYISLTDNSCVVLECEGGFFGNFEYQLKRLQKGDGIGAHLSFMFAYSKVQPGDSRDKEFTARTN